MLNINTLLFDKNHSGTATWRFPAEDACVTVPEMGEKVKRYAEVLKKNHIGQGDKIGFILDNSYDLVCLLFATWYLNAIAVPLRTRSGRYHNFQKYLGKCDEVCDFNLVIFEGESITDDMSHWARASGKSVIPIQNIVASARKSRTTNNIQAAAISPDDMAIIQFSSGSTGDPKGVVVTHGMMMAQLQKHPRQSRPLSRSTRWLHQRHGCRSIMIWVYLLACCHRFFQPAITCCLHPLFT